MVSPWSIAPPHADARDTRRELMLAHETLMHHGLAGDPSVRGRRDRADQLDLYRGPASGVRNLVRESWERSLSLHLDPDAAPAGLDLEDEELREYRDAHPLSGILPVVHKLLIHHAFDSGLIVAIGDEAGRLLWIDGDRDLRRRAEQMLFIEGANWSERRMGTSAPGTALALDHGIQIQGAEHFARSVHPWSCTAVPVHDPVSRAVLGVLDITGGDDAVAAQTLPLLEATVAAVEAELRLRSMMRSVQRTVRPPVRRTEQRTEQPSAEPTAPGVAPDAAPGVRQRTGFTRAQVPVPRTGAPVLHLLGRSRGLLEAGGTALELSARHSEILALLAWHRDGLSAEQLASHLYNRVDSLVTLRAEMVRLRRVLQAVDPALVPVSRPYRLPRRIELDAQRVIALLERGAHRVALASYRGPVLPGSLAPGIADLRGEVSVRLRDAILADAASDTMLAYARMDEAADDVEVWTAALRLLPARSPKRAGVVSHIERIERELTVVSARAHRATERNPDATSFSLE